MFRAFDNVYDLNFNGREGAEKVTYGEPYSCRPSRNILRHNFEYADTEILFRHFEDAERECQALLKAGASGEKGGLHLCVFARPYDQCIKASHVFNLLDARGVISVTERQSYILRVAQSGQGLRRGVPARRMPAVWASRSRPRIYGSPQPL